MTILPAVHWVMALAQDRRSHSTQDYWPATRARRGYLKGRRAIGDVGEYLKASRGR